jgi:hypothetical protein
MLKISIDRPASIVILMYDDYCISLYHQYILLHMIYIERDTVKIVRVIMGLLVHLYYVCRIARFPRAHAVL